MEFTKTGSYHVSNGINNQDAILHQGKLKAIFDGCSGGKNSEVGAKLFAQLFAMQEGFDNVSKFEENCENTFKAMLQMCGYTIKEEVTDKIAKFMFDNYCFTMFFCFEEDEGFVVKYIGDGTIITLNNEDQISYITLRYGAAPPYFVYNYMPDKYKGGFFDTLGFKTFRFSKSEFKNIGVASDGIFPIVRGSEEIDKKTKTQFETNNFSFDEMNKFDSCILQKLPINVLGRFIAVNAKTGIFSDDITIVF